MYPNKYIFVYIICVRFFFRFKFYRICILNDFNLFGRIFRKNDSLIGYYRNQEKIIFGNIFTDFKQKEFKIVLVVCIHMDRNSHVAIFVCLYS